MRRYIRTSIVQLEATSRGSLPSLQPRNSSLREDAYGDDLIISVTFITLRMSDGKKWSLLTSPSSLTLNDLTKKRTKHGVVIAFKSYNYNVRLQLCRLEVLCSQVHRKNTQITSDSLKTVQLFVFCLFARHPTARASVTLTG